MLSLWEILKTGEKAAFVKITIQKLEKLVNNRIYLNKTKPSHFCFPLLGSLWKSKFMTKRFLPHTK